MANRRPTLAKVAALAGVSVSQASDALRGGGRVSAATRERVRSAAQQLGYQTQAVAKVLREGVTAFIAVLADRATTHTADGSMHPFWAKFLTSFTVTVREYGYAVILDFDGAEADIRRLPAQAVLTLTSDASRVASLKGGGFGQVVALSPDADPAVLVDPGAHAVVFQHDYRAIGAEVADFLHARGCRRICVLQRPGRHWYAAEVQAGLTDRADELGMSVVGHPVDVGPDGVTPAVRAALPHEVDGVLDFNGVTAALEAVVAERGRSIQPTAADDAVVVVSQGEGTDPGADPCVHYLSFLGSECGEIIAEHFVALLYGRSLASPDLPHALVEATGVGAATTVGS